MKWEQRDGEREMEGAGERASERPPRPLRPLPHSNKVKRECQADVNVVKFMLAGALNKSLVSLRRLSWSRVLFLLYAT